MSTKVYKRPKYCTGCNTIPCKDFKNYGKYHSEYAKICPFWTIDFGFYGKVVDQKDDYIFIDDELGFHHDDEYKYKIDE